MNYRKYYNKQASNKVVECNEAQEEFKQLCLEHKDELIGKIITHRGVQIKIGGAGNSTLMYYIAVKGLSDKKEVEYPKLFLDWDDTALEEDIVPQVHSILGAIEPVQETINIADMCGK